MHTTHHARCETVDANLTCRQLLTSTQPPFSIHSTITPTTITHPLPHFARLVLSFTAVVGEKLSTSATGCSRRRSSACVTVRGYGAARTRARGDEGEDDTDAPPHATILTHPHALSQSKRAPMAVVLLSTLFLNGRERPWRWWS